MYAIRYNPNQDAKLWDTGIPLGWVITRDDDVPFFDEQDKQDIVDEIKAEERRIEEMYL